MSLLGIDAGGTRTVCVLADTEGRSINEAHGPGANLQSMGELEVEKTLHDVIGRAVGRESPPLAICLGMAGVDRPGDAETVRDILRRIGHRAEVLVVNDALIALETGVPGGAGTVVIAGTGSIAYGRSHDGRAARAGGWGYVLGDEGSGYWLGRLALRAVVRASDGRGPETALTDRILSHYGVSRAQDLVRHIYISGARPGAIATLARAVGAAADAGDAVAVNLITIGARELASAAVSVARRVNIEADPVILAGGTLLGLKRLRESLTRELAVQLPRASVRPLENTPALGAIRFARAALAGSLVLPAYEESP